MTSITLLLQFLVKNYHHSMKLKALIEEIALYTLAYQRKLKANQAKQQESTKRKHS